MNGVNAVGSAIDAGMPHSERNAQKAPHTDFLSVFREAFDRVNQYQIEADRLTDELIAGKVDNLHQVMIASQQANISLQFAVQVRNKVVEAYQEMMRMQV